MHESLNNMNPGDPGLNHRIARRPKRRKPRSCQGISYRNQPGKLCLDERLFGKTALARGFARTECKCRYQENSSQHSKRLHAFILFRTHRIRQSKSGTRRADPPAGARADRGNTSAINGRRRRLSGEAFLPPSRRCALPRSRDFPVAKQIQQRTGHHRGDDRHQDEHREDVQGKNA